MIDYLAGLAATYTGYSTALIADAPISAGEVTTARVMSCFLNNQPASQWR